MCQHFRRFLLAWKKFGYEKQLNARVVHYADNYVICCKPSTVEAANKGMLRIVRGIGLEVNHDKTQVVNVANKEHFDFLGYTIGQFHNKTGKTYYGTHPSKRSLQKVIEKIHNETSRRWLTTTAEKRVLEVNQILRGWCWYFNQWLVLGSYKTLRKYTEKRLRRWLVNKHKLGSTTGYRQFPDEFLYRELGLYEIAQKMVDVPSAKV